MADRPRHPDLLTRHEAAAWVGMSAKYLDEVAAAGELPAVRQGRRVFFWRADLNAYLARCTTTSAAGTSARAGDAGARGGSSVSTHRGRPSEREIERRLRTKLHACRPSQGAPPRQR